MFITRKLTKISPVLAMIVFAIWDGLWTWGLWYWAHEAGDHSISRAIAKWLILGVVFFAFFNDRMTAIGKCLQEEIDEEFEKLKAKIAGGNDE